jgi:hypothetical protein
MSGVQDHSPVSSAQYFSYTLPQQSGRNILFFKVVVMRIMPVFFLVFLMMPFSGSARKDDPIARCNVVWNAPSSDSSGSMPIGNGDIGLNVWVEEEGGLLFYIGKTDAWNGNCQLLKLGRVRFDLIPNPFRKGMPFRQTLDLHTGEIRIEAGPPESAVTLRVWVDANQPVIRVEAEGKEPFTVRAALESWRKERRPLREGELFAAYGVRGDSTRQVMIDADHIVERGKDRVAWYYRNEESCYPANLTLQGLESLLEKYPDPLLHRTFGGCMKGAGMHREGLNILISDHPGKRGSVSVYCLTAQTPSPEGWLSRLDETVGKTDRISWNKARDEHRKWWNDFWNRSWIAVSGSPEAEAVTLGYTLQNWIHACGGRGTCPIKFNGSVFTVDAKIKDESFDADYRSWGGPYWFQNTRLPYWSMLSAGNFDLMEPLFEMYRNALPLAEDRTRIWYGHPGVFFPETMYFWGTHVDDNYGRERAGKPHGLTDNRYIRYEWQGGIELAVMMLDYYDYTGDREFFRETLLPFVAGITAFYSRHYPRESNGVIRFEPAQALETWWDSVNPLPEIAGLRSMLPRLIALPEGVVPEGDRAGWRALLNSLPPLPVKRTDDGADVLAPAAMTGPKQNSETPELYAVFPYRLFGVGKENPDLAFRTWERREPKGTGGWRQDAIIAALLGRADEAGRMVATNFTRKHEGSRFPAFWGPNYDWIPDQDHGSVAMIALQSMIIQADGSAIRLLPAWPKGWDVDFRLHAPCRTVVEGSVRDGKLKRLKVTPRSREKDVLQPE